MGYVQLLTLVESGAPAGLGERLAPGNPRNPFSTSPALLLDRWVAAWLGCGAPDALVVLQSHITTADVLQVVYMWRALLAKPAFKAELTHVRDHWPCFETQIAQLHVRMLIMVLLTRLVRAELGDAATTGLTLPYMAQPDYRISHELQLTNKLHPWLRPTFVMHPRWLSRRSRWSLTALHTLMCSLQRLRVPQRMWIVSASGIEAAPLGYQALYTRVPIGHSSAAPVALQHSGLYADPTVCMLLPDFSTQLTSLLRNQRAWKMFSRGASHEPGLHGLMQWREWKTVPAEVSELYPLNAEPLYNPTPPTSKKSSAFTHMREVHFEMYKRWVSLNKNVPRRTDTVDADIFDAAFGSLERFMTGLYADVVDWTTLSMNQARVNDLEAHALQLMAAALQQVPENPRADLLRQMRENSWADAFAVEYVEL